MSRYVVGASAAAEHLLRTSLALKIAAVIEGNLLLASELLDLEVLSVLRRAVLGRQLNKQRAVRAIEDLMDRPIDRRDFVEGGRRAQQTDALYVAAARLTDAPLITAHGPLARAPSFGIIVEKLRSQAAIL